MKTRAILLTVLLMTLCCLGMAYAQDEEITLTTYYPAPFGEYGDLVTDSMAVGRTYGIPAANNLVVEGNVGIGTTSPDKKLVVSGEAGITGTTYIGYNGNAELITRHVNGKQVTSNAYDTLYLQYQANGKGVNIGQASTNNHPLNVYGPGYFSGRLGIGTTSPGDTLDIGVGGIRLSGYSPHIWFTGPEIPRILCTNRIGLFINCDTGTYTHIGYHNPGHITLANAANGPAGNVAIGGTSWNPTYKLQMGVRSAGMPGGGSWADSSDKRLKKNISTISDALEKITQLRGINFEWINPEEHQAFGIRQSFIAQEVEKVFPNFITEIDASGKDKELVGETKIKSLDLPFDFDAYLVEAIKEQQVEIDGFKAEMKELKAKNTELETIIKQIEVRLNK